MDYVKDVTYGSISSLCDKLKMYRFVSESVYCSITDCIYSDPVTAADGHIYERDAIQEWFKRSCTSPMTGLNISGKLYPSFLMKSMVSKYLEINPEMKAYQYKRPLSSHDIVVCGLCDKISTLEVFHINTVRASFLSEFITLCNHTQVIDLINRSVYDEKTSDGKTLAHVLCLESDRLDYVKYLVNFGVNFNTVDDYGRTMFHVACKYGSKTMIKYLIGVSTCLDGADNKGDRPIDELRDSSLIKLMKEKGITPK
jgi:hypothetical protein